MPNRMQQRGQKFVLNSQSVSYVGRLPTDAADGVGVFYNADLRLKYCGEFRNDRFDGAGVHDYSSGNRYLGEFKDGSRSGAGAYEFASGSRYWGEYKEDKRSGSGLYTWPDGKAFWGEFQNDMPDGVAISVASGIMLFERWNNGEKLSGVPFDGSNADHHKTLRQAQDAKVTYTS